MDIEAARQNMIKQQIRSMGVLDEDVLNVLERTPREAFIPESYQNLAFADTALPIGHGQKLWTPMEEARLLQALDIYPDDRILEVGTMNGYMTALMAQLGHHVYSVDYYAEFTRAARQRLRQMNITNVTFDTGDASQGWGYYAPYDVILINGSLADVPQGYHEDVNEFGRLLVVLGHAPVMQATLIQRWSLDEWRRQKLFETMRPRLPGVEDAAKFIF